LIEINESTIEPEFVFEIDAYKVVEGDFIVHKDEIMYVEDVEKLENTPLPTVAISAKGPHGHRDVMFFHFDEGVQIYCPKTDDYDDIKDREGYQQFADGGYDDEEDYDMFWNNRHGWDSYHGYRSVKKTYSPVMPVPLPASTILSNVKDIFRRQ